MFNNQSIVTSFLVKKINKIKKQNTDEKYYLDPDLDPLFSDFSKGMVSKWIIQQF